MTLDLSKATEALMAASPVVFQYSGHPTPRLVSHEPYRARETAQRQLEAALPLVIEALAEQAAADSVRLFPRERGLLADWLRAKAEEARG